MNGQVRKVCTKRTFHGPHSWWSRRHRRYFMCGGRASGGRA